MEKHKKFETSKVCGKCSELCTIDTSVTIMSGEDKKNLGALVGKSSEEIIRFCTEVMDVIGVFKQGAVWSLGCTVQGKPLQDESILKHLFMGTFYSLAEKNMSNHKMYRPTYEELNQRKESFYEKWPKEKYSFGEKLADAGFLLIKHPNQTCCFNCGVYVNDWDENDDPWLRHAQVCPFCPYIKSYMAKEKIDEAKKIAISKRKVPNTVYESKEARINSFQIFDVKYVKGFATCGKERETLIHEFVDAGFFYSGSIDMVECYSCGLKISSIKPKDDFDLTHARLSSKCKYIVDKLGQERIELVLRAARNNDFEEKTEIVLLLKTLDKEPRRTWPPNIFKPV